MKIEELHLMKGPNYWSVEQHKLAVAKVFTEDQENFTGIFQKIKVMLPELGESPTIASLLINTCVELLRRGGTINTFSKIEYSDSENIHTLIFNYNEEKAAVYALESTLSLVEAVIAGKDYDVNKDIKELNYIKEEEAFGPSTQSIVEEAIKRNIPVHRLNGNSLIQFGHGVNQKRIRATIASTTSNISVDIACNKDETKIILKSAMIPVPEGKIVYDEADLGNAVKELGFPLVIKPVDGNHGKGATINITSIEQALEGLKTAKKISPKVIVERFIVGFDFRLLVINYRLVAAAKRTPAYVTGNGAFTIQELIDEVNSDPKRCKGHNNVLTRIEIDKMTSDILSEKNLNLQSVLPYGETLYLKTTANLSTGGTATDVTDLVHPYNIFLAERIARTIGLDICGIDIMAPDLNTPLNKNGGAVLEVNAAPGFRMHVCPSEGLSRNVAEPVIEMLYPSGSLATIPIIAVTGTNGKTTTTRLIAHIVKTAGFKAGFTTSDGVYIQNKLVLEGDCTGPQSTEIVLNDATVDYAVLECARGGILKAGLGFSKCDVAVVTNITEDHLGLKGINTIEELANVKAVIPMSVRKEGYAVLNADDELVYHLSKKTSGKVAFFSLSANNPRIEKHCENGGLATIIEDNYITICNGSWKKRIAKVDEVPLTFSGNASGMIQNVLAAVTAAFVQNIKVEDIKLAITTFIPSEKLTPGRMNLFEFRNFNLLVDYAHNSGGYEALSQFLNKTKSDYKIGIVGGVGDRRDVDIINTGKWAAANFNEIIIRNDKLLRGRTIDEINNLIIKGIFEVNPQAKFTVIPKEQDAINHAVENAKAGSFITLCCDQITEAISYVKELQDKDQQSPNVFPVFVNNSSNNDGEISHLKKVS